MATPPRTAPVSSVTLPVTLALTTCPRTGETRPAASTSASQTTRPPLRLMFMNPYLLLWAVAIDGTGHPSRPWAGVDTHVGGPGYDIITMTDASEIRANPRDTRCRHPTADLFCANSRDFQRG